MLRLVWLLVLPALALACGDVTFDLGSVQPRRAAGARVERVVDGDTVVLSGVGKARLIGVDTPEVYGGVECYGRAASAYAKRDARRPRACAGATTSSSATATTARSSTCGSTTGGSSTRCSSARASRRRSRSRRTSRSPTASSPTPGRATFRTWPVGGLRRRPRVDSTGVMRMRQSFAQFEEAFLEESQADAARRERLRREAA